MTLHHHSRSTLVGATALLVAVSLGGSALAASAAPTAPASPAAPPASDAATWTARAVATYDAMQDNLYLGARGSGLYRANTSDEGNPYSYFWDYREATQATADLSGIRGVAGAYTNVAAQRIAGMEHYFEVRPGGRAGYDSYVPAPLGTGGDVYYDDNAIAGLTQVRAFLATGQPAYLEDARSTFDIVIRGWNTDAALVCPGGMDWIDRPDNTTRGANITGLTAELAAHLYEQTDRPEYLAWSKKLYRWNNECLKTAPGLYANSYDDDGTLNPTLWTYNSGSMIATAALLYRSTGDAAYLKQAKAAARGSLAYWTAENRLQQQPAIFNAFYFRDLLLLDSISHDPSYRAAIESFANATWSSNRDPATGLFHFEPSGGGDFTPTRPAATLDQAGMIQILAMLAWDPADLGRIS